MKTVKPRIVNTAGSISRSSTASYFDKTGTLQIAGINVVRVNYDPITLEFLGILIENAATNILLNSTNANLATQTRTVTSGTTYTLSFYGAGRITLSGAHAAVITGTGAYPVRRTYTFTTTTTSLTLTVNTTSGGVGLAQLETGSVATSWIQTAGSPVTRAADIISLSGTGLAYTTVENFQEEWLSTATYSLGTSVCYGIDGVYISLQNGNTNQNPLTATTYWRRTGPTNKMAAFDDQISTITYPTGGGGPTTNVDIIFAVFVADTIDTVGLLNVGGSGTAVAVRDAVSKTLLYNETKAFSIGGQSFENTAVYTDIPTTPNTTLVSVRITGAFTSIGTFVTGLATNLGNTQYGASAGIIDYSRKETDEFGNITFVRRNYSKRLNANVSVINSNLNNVQKTLYDLRSTPALWIASSDAQFEESLVVYGFYRDFSTDIAYPTYSICNLQIEGLI
jgi:hypothetical protein